MDPGNILHVRVRHGDVQRLGECISPCYRNALLCLCSLVTIVHRRHAGLATRVCRRIGAPSSTPGGRIVDTLHASGDPEGAVDVLYCSTPGRALIEAACDPTERIGATECEAI